MSTTPNYKKIYKDIISEKFPDCTECDTILSKKKLSQLDVIRINDILFKKSPETPPLKRTHCSYSKETILEILDYQKKNKLNNSQLSKHFKLSRNSITKWKKIFVF